MSVQRVAVYILITYLL